MKLRNLLLLLPVLISFQPAPSECVIPEQPGSPDITGTYRADRFILEIKKDHKFKSTIIAPRSLVSKGHWQLGNDTLTCYITRRNTVLQGDASKLKEHPEVEKFVVENGQLYGLSVEEGKIARVPLVKE
jgi:hypothetical protein